MSDIPVIVKVRQPTHAIVVKQDKHASVRQRTQDDAKISVRAPTQTKVKIKLENDLKIKARQLAAAAELVYLYNLDGGEF